MISREEARLGTLMANLFVVLLLVNFGIQIFVLGPDQVGYNQTWGPLLSATGFAVGFAFLFVIFLGTKLFGGEDNPYVNITGSIAFVAQAVNTIPAFAGVAQENDTDAFLTTNQVLDATSGVNSGWGVMIGIFGLVVIRSSLSKQLIPNYGILCRLGWCHTYFGIYSWFRIWSFTRGLRNSRFCFRRIIVVSIIYFFTRESFYKFSKLNN